MAAATQYLLGLGVIWLLLVIIWIAFSHVDPKITSFLRKPVRLKAYKMSVSDYVANTAGFDYSNYRYNSSDKIPLFPLGELLKWNPNDVSSHSWIESKAHPNRGKSIPRFNFLDKAERSEGFRLREAEIPFIFYNHPSMKSASVAFSYDNLLSNFGSRKLKISQSKSNKFMYYNIKSSTKEGRIGWSPPQETTRMAFGDFINFAEIAEAKGDITSEYSPLYYLTISASEGGRTAWIRDALPFFNLSNSDFIVDSSKSRGINCRFGMKGVIAAAHYDGGRNFVAMIRGRKRFILLPPDQCNNLLLLPRGHPSARHSRVDWTNATDYTPYSQFVNALATEVVLIGGEMLYIPSYWLHYMVSQDANIQCNSRSGDSRIGRKEIEKCGFYPENLLRAKKDFNLVRELRG